MGSGLAALGVRSFFARSNADPIMPAAVGQPSLDTERAEGIWELRFVLIGRET